MPESFSGWLSTAKHCPSANCDTRPDRNDVNTLVIHCISLPEGEYGTGDIEALFTNQLDCDKHSSYQSLKNMKVSSHFFIDRKGHVTQFVSAYDRAWHCGQSQFKGQDGCNDFTIGVELEGTDHSDFSDLQYESLIKLTQTLQHYFPAITVDRIIGHSDIAPQRKTDPGSYFDWKRYRNAL